MPDTTQPTPTAAPASPTIDQLASALGNPFRWQLLAEMSAGGWHMIADLADRFGIKPAIISKHLAILRASGLVIANRAKLNAIAPVWLTAPGEITAGPCTLRFKKEA